MDQDQLEQKSDRDLILVLIEEVRLLSTHSLKANKSLAALEEKLTLHDTKIEEIQLESRSNVKKVEEKLNTQVLKINEQHEQLTEKVKIVNDDCRKQDQTIHDLQSKLAKLTTKLHDKSNELDKIHTRLEITDQESRRANLIINGLELKKGETSWAAAEYFIKSKLKGDPEAISPTGSKFIKGRGGNPAVLISLGSPEDKQYLYSLSKNLKNTLFSLDDDLTPKQRAKKSILLKRRREILATTPTARVRVNVDTMEVDGNFFKLNEKDEIVPVPPKIDTNRNKPLSQPKSA
jgi:hypothetical protein